MPENLPPCEVMLTNACSICGNPTWPDSTSFFTSESDTPNCLASSPMIGIPRPVSWLMSSAKSRPWTRALPYNSAISLTGACTPADTSPMRASVAATVSEPSPKAINLRPASASSGNSNGVFAPSSRSCASVCSALPASPINVVNATLVCSKSAAEVTALIPAASATPPPASAAPIPTFNPAALRLAIFLADAETSCVALAMDCFNAEMSAPRVTVSALMRRGWRQLEMGNITDQATARGNVASKEKLPSYATLREQGRPICCLVAPCSAILFFETAAIQS